MSHSVALSKRLNLYYQGKVIAFARAGTILNTLMLDFDPPDNPITGKLRHDFKKDSVYRDRLLSVEDESFFYCAMGRGLAH